MRRKVEIKGTKELKKRMLQLAQLDAAKKIVRYHTHELHRNASRMVPVDTGFLKRSIVTEFQNGGLVGIVRAEAAYAGFVELGTIKMRAQPYIGPAYNMVKEPFRANLARINMEK